MYNSCTFIEYMNIKVYNYRINEGKMINDKIVYNDVLFRIKIDVPEKRYYITTKNDINIKRNTVLHSDASSLGFLDGSYIKKTIDNIQACLTRVKNDIETIEALGLISGEYIDRDEFIEDVLSFNNFLGNKIAS